MTAAQCCCYGLLEITINLKKAAVEKGLSSSKVHFVCVIIMGKSGPFFLHVYDVVRSWCLDSSLPFFHLISRWAILRVSRAGAEFLFSAQLSSDGFG